MRTHQRHALTVASTLGLAALSAHGQMYHFNLESTPVGHAPSLTLGQIGLVVTISRPASDFKVIQRSDLPASWGNRAIFSAPSTGTATRPLLFEFSEGLRGITFQTGDFGGDADTITATAYEGPGGTGDAMDSEVIHWNLGNPSTASPAPTPPATISLSPPVGRRIRSMVLSSQSAEGDSMAYDNFLFAVPDGCAGPDLTTTAIPGQPGYGVPNGLMTNDDFFFYLTQFSHGNLAVADLTTTAIHNTPGYGIPDGTLNNDDFFYFLAWFAGGC